jgi:hypothetical protein
LLDVAVFPRLQPTFGRGQIRELKIPGGVAMNWSVRPPIRIAVPPCINPEVDAGAGDRARTLRRAFHDSTRHVIRASRRAWEGVRSDRCGWGSGGRRRGRHGSVTARDGECCKTDGGDSFPHTAHLQRTLVRRDVDASGADELAAPTIMRRNRADLTKDHND